MGKLVLFVQAVCKGKIEGEGMKGGRRVEKGSLKRKGRGLIFFREVFAENRPVKIPDLRTLKPKYLSLNGLMLTEFPIHNFNWTAIEWMYVVKQEGVGRGGGGGGGGKGTI